MEANMKGIERALRIAAGIGLTAWAAAGGPAWAWIGVVPLATGSVGVCPLYFLLKGKGGCKGQCKGGEQAPKG